MHRLWMAAAGFASAMIVLSSTPAFAEFGAFAIDEATGKYGYSWREANPKQAASEALKGCDTTGCKVVFTIGPRRCGAIAMTSDGKIWGGSDKATRAEAELHAMQACQKRTKVQCQIKASECNR